jgi:hypothetical protein
MTDPAITPDPAAARSRLNRLFLFSSAADVLVGLVLAVVGVASDLEALSIAGFALALCGAGVLAWLIVRTNQPEQL